MNDIQLLINKYLDYCSHQKRLDKKTIKAYHIDLDQFMNCISKTQLTDITQDTLELYISYLHKNYQPKTVKRKIASLKSMFHYFEYKGLIVQNPFSKMQIRFREPIILPKTIPLHTVEYLLKVIYIQQTSAKTAYQRKTAIRDAFDSQTLNGFASHANNGDKP
jgi:integrase/recombinase XerD